MPSFDESQQQVLQLDPTQHARIIGAPGTGKTHMLIESYFRLTNGAGFADAEIAVVTPNRQTAAELRARIEQQSQRVIEGVVARTPASLAFDILQLQSALNGTRSPRLLSGALHDEVVASIVDDLKTRKFVPHHTPPFVYEVISSRQYRDELREIDRVLHDYGLRPRQLTNVLLNQTERLNITPAQRETWLSCADILHEVQLRTQQKYPGQFTTAQLFASAAVAVAEDHRIPVPNILLIDNAAEIGEGALGLLVQLADRGSCIWAFGDPDTATNAFQGERTKLLTGVVTELHRKSHSRVKTTSREQVCLLNEVHRHNSQVRALVRKVTENIGTAGLGQQRGAISAEPTEHAGLVQFVTAPHPAEQVAVIAHRLRERHLGIGSVKTVPWSEMVIVCRTRDEVHRLSSQLAAHEVPTIVASGGIVLREHQIVRELISLTKYAMGHLEATEQFVQEILTGIVCSIDTISLKRFRRALHNLVQGTRTSHDAEQPTADTQTVRPTVDSVLAAAFVHPGSEPLVDMRPARQLRNIALAVQTARQLHEDGGTAREVLWSIWQSTHLAEKLQHQALHEPQLKADEAHRMLDAVLALFFALQREEEQGGARSISEVFDELLASDVPQDTIATRSFRDAVTVATPQSLIGREYDLVCVTSLQEGVWPNTKPRGSLLGSVALERFLRSEDARTPTRKETLHDELRLFATAISRAKQELLVISVANEDNHPSVFFGLGSAYLIEQRLPSNRLTLRGYVAELRRRVVQNVDDAQAVASLAHLAQLGVAGAHPDEWYGVQPPSTEKPLVELEHDDHAKVFVSPSQIETAETCPLDWFIKHLGGAQPNAKAQVGTLLHHALEHAHPDASTEDLLEVVQSHWSELTFEASWQEDRASNDTREMAEAAAQYLRDFSQRKGELHQTEAKFEVPIDFAILRGSADRVEISPAEDRTSEISVIDFKTGSHKPSSDELKEHAQLLSYQLAVVRNAFDVPGENGHAKLVFIHPKAVTQTQRKKGEKYAVLEQAAIDEHTMQQFEQRVIEIARVISAGQFTAQVEHHCTNPHAPSKSCALHVIGSVNQT